MNGRAQSEAVETVSTKLPTIESVMEVADQVVGSGAGVPGAATQGVHSMREKGERTLSSPASMTETPIPSRSASSREKKKTPEPPEFRERWDQVLGSLERFSF